MTTNKDIERQNRDKKLVEDYEQTLKRDGAVNKTALGQRHGVSLRTAKRILDAAGIDHQNAGGKPTPKKQAAAKKPSKPAKPSVSSAAEKPPKKDKPSAKESADRLKKSEDSTDTSTKTKPEQGILSWTAQTEKQVITIVTTSGNQIVVDKANPNYDDILKGLAFGKAAVADILRMADMKELVKDLKQGNFELRNGTVFFNGVVVKGPLIERIKSLIERDEPFEHLVKFYENLLGCPSKDIYDRLWAFLENNDVTINADGNIVAYKSVTKDFKDQHSNRIDNSVGTYVSMRRSDVVEDENQTCASGLHIAALHYLRSFWRPRKGSEKVVRCTIRPQDFVSIPEEYHNAKVRVCAYTVESDFTDEYFKNK